MSVTSTSAVLAALAAAVSLASFPEPAVAQSTPASDAAELSSIDDESRASVGLYVASGALAVGGATSLALSFGYFGGFVVPACPPPCMLPRDAPAAFGFFIAGVTAISLAAVLLGLAIGLDVDSGSRRGAQIARRTAPLTLVPGPGELGVGLVLRFDL